MPRSELRSSRAPLGPHAQTRPSATADTAPPSRPRRPARTRARSKWARQLTCALSGRSGQTVIEMAVALPSFLLLLIGICNFSIVMFDFENATFACRVGARYASVNSATSRSPCTSTGVKAIVQSYLWASPSSTTVSVNWPSGNAVGGTVTVSVNAVYPLAIPFFSGTSVTVGSTEQRAIVR